MVLFKYMEKIIIGIIIILIIIFAGYWFLSDESPVELTESTGDAQDIDFVNKVASFDWETYSDEVEGISFKYPSGWIIAAGQDERGALTAIRTPDYEGYPAYQGAEIRITKIWPRAVEDYDPEIELENKLKFLKENEKIITSSIQYREVSELPAATYTYIQTDGELSELTTSFYFGKHGYSIRLEVQAPPGSLNTTLQPYQDIYKRVLDSMEIE